MDSGPHSNCMLRPVVRFSAGAPPFSVIGVRIGGGGCRVLIMPKALLILVTVCPEGEPDPRVISIRVRLAAA